MLLRTLGSVITLALLVPAPEAQGALIRVPLDQPTIQAGLAAASAGDTVLVECGTYYECGIQMKSGVALTSATGQADCVTIDAEQGDRILECYEVDETTVIEGLTFANGLSPESSPTELGGGAIRCRFSSPWIRNCSFVNNSSPLTGGGAIGANPMPLKVTSCTFYGNSTADNLGGAIFSMVGTTEIRDCLFVDNSSAGGAVACLLCSAMIEDCLFERNSSSAHGGAVDLYSCGASIAGCTFTENTATDFAGGVLCNMGSDATIQGCTFVRNAAGSGAGVATGINSHPVLLSSIIAFSEGGGAVYCHDYEPGSISLTCCDLYGNAGGDWIDCATGQQGVGGNICEDPLFCGDDTPDAPYALFPDSPCAAANSHGCGLIGSWDVGCQSPVERRTWGVIKSLFR